MLLKGNCLELLADLPDNSVDSIVTDPPYELGFMGKSWDNSGIAHSTDLWAECLRVLKPGGHLLAFSGSRTYHRMVMAIEDAGFEIRDQIMWIYASGFPKSHNVSIAIDKQAKVMGHRGTRVSIAGNSRDGQNLPNASTVAAHEPITPEAQQWQGWGTALKPAFEPVVVARKPLRNKDYCDWMGSHFATLQAWLRQEVENQIQTGEADDSFVPMDTSLPESATTTFLNIVSSWLNILADLYHHENMYTTSIASGMTTDWKTLHSLALKITPESITREQTNPSGLQSTVSVVGNLLSGAWLSLQGIQGLSAIGSATDFTLERRPAGTEVSHEPIVVARKPLEGTVANNVLTYGTGAINIDGSRVGENPGYKYNADSNGTTFHGEQGNRAKQTAEKKGSAVIESTQGRWPANVIHDGSDEVLAGFPTAKGGTWNTTAGARHFNNDGEPTLYKTSKTDNSSGSAARFFYCAKASKSERNAGLELCTCDKLSPWENVGQQVAHQTDTEPLAPRDTEESGIQNNSDSEWNTSLYGSDATDPCLTDCKSITLTTTNSTTTSATSDLLAQSNISVCTQGANCETECGGSHARSADNSSQSPMSIGTSAERDGLVTADADLATSASLSQVSAKGVLFCARCDGLKGGHPTVKPLALMRYLIKLVTPPNGIVLDPFLGSGTTAVAAILEGFQWIGCEMTEDYWPIIEARILWAAEEYAVAAQAPKTLF